MGQTLTSLQWYSYGKKHFRQSGYLQHIKSTLYYPSPVQSRADIGLNQEGADGVNLRGKVYVITGANSGIGKEVATYVAAKGAKLYMLCRSQERAEQARTEIQSQTSNEDIHIVPVDVGELVQVQSAARWIQQHEDKIDCLVCNAGVLLNEHTLTSEGLEVTIASHLIGGSYLLSQLLLPQLYAAATAMATSDAETSEISLTGMTPRVIFVSSGGMYLTKFPSWQDAIGPLCTTNGSMKPKVKYDGVMMYSYAKRGQVLLAEQMAKRHPKITWVTCHPGWTATAAVQDAFGDKKSFFEPMRTVWQGAEGITWLMNPKNRIENGAFYLDRKKEMKHIAGLFFSEGTITKNTEDEIQDMMKNLERICSTYL